MVEHLPGAFHLDQAPKRKLAREGLGLTFVLHHPVRGAGQTTDTARCRVLVVEDEPLVAMVIEDAIGELGHEVPVLLISGYNVESLPERLQGETLLRKPFTVEQLDLELRDLCARAISF